MPNIVVLDVATSNRIAAGEVVERPASIAKELMENSLDAGATAITIEVREGGIDYLRVTDNGKGIPPGEVRIAFEQHATSKLRSGDDLTSIATLGFRGEALPSIASVAKVEVTTRRQGQDSGTRMTIEGGHVLDIRDAGSPEGTTMVVRDLFFNTPARKAFLKRASTEGGYVGDTVLQIALARYDVSFRFVQNGKTVFHTPGGGDLTKTVQTLFGREIGQGLLPIDAQLPMGRIHGLLGLQDAARTNRQREYFIVNGRAIRSPFLALTLEEGIRGQIAIGKYPFCVLHIELPLDKIDVNVHPNKIEVRFQEEASIRSSILSVLEEQLHPTIAQQSVPIFAPTPLPKLSSIVEKMDVLPDFSSAPTTPGVTVSEASDALLPPLKDRAKATPLVAQIKVDPPAKPLQQGFSVCEIATVEPTTLLPNRPHTLIGTLFSTYLVVETGQDLLLVDQHAAHERLLYEKLVTSFGSKTLSQSLLVPYTFDVTPRERERLEDSLVPMKALGFEIEEFGSNTYRVFAVPHILGEPQVRGFLLALIDQLEEIASLRAVDLKRDAIASIACHKAVKAGDHLSDQELEHLLTLVFEEKTPLTCPHGRPILLKMTKAELEKRFRRMQA